MMKHTNATEKADNERRGEINKKKERKEAEEKRSEKRNLANILASWREK